MWAVVEDLENLQVIGFSRKSRIDACVEPANYVGSELDAFASTAFVFPCTAALAAAVARDVCPCAILVDGVLDAAPVVCPWLDAYRSALAIATRRIVPPARGPLARQRSLFLGALDARIDSMMYEAPFGADEVTLWE